jgi:chaperonin GroEL (HSP60 family)
MLKNNVIEPIRLGLNEILVASEAATMILRIDDVIASKGGGGKMPPQMPPGGGMGGMDDY